MVYYTQKWLNQEYGNDLDLVQLKKTEKLDGM